ncbi:MAG: hypothetical protein ACPGUV_00950 [Polyangiales bacterium]
MHDAQPRLAPLDLTTAVVRYFANDFAGRVVWWQAPEDVIPHAALQPLCSRWQAVNAASQAPLQTSSRDDWWVHVLPHTAEAACVRHLAAQHDAAGHIVALMADGPEAEWHSSLERWHLALCGWRQPWQLSLVAQPQVCLITPTEVPPQSTPTSFFDDAALTGHSVAAALFLHRRHPAPEAIGIIAVAPQPSSPTQAVQDVARPQCVTLQPGKEPHLGDLTAILARQARAFKRVRQRLQRARRLQRALRHRLWQAAQASDDNVRLRAEIRAAQAHALRAESAAVKRRYQAQAVCGETAALPTTRTPEVSLPQVPSALSCSVDEAVTHTLEGALQGMRLRVHALEIEQSAQQRRRLQAYAREVDELRRQLEAQKSDSRARKQQTEQRAALHASQALVRRLHHELAQHEREHAPLLHEIGRLQQENADLRAAVLAHVSEHSQLSTEGERKASQAAEVAKRATQQVSELHAQLRDHEAHIATAVERTTQEAARLQQATQTLQALRDALRQTLQQGADQGAFISLAWNAPLSEDDPPARAPSMPPR